MFITNETGQPLIGKVVWEERWGLWAGDRAAVQGKSQIQKPPCQVGQREVGVLTAGGHNS